MTTQDLLGENFLAYLLLAIGGALVVGNGLALVKPRPDEDGNLIKAPLGRSLVQIFIGAVASIWALGSIMA
jgi:hypothetical protein